MNHIIEVTPQKMKWTLDGPIYISKLAIELDPIRLVFN